MSEKDLREDQSIAPVPAEATGRPQRTVTGGVILRHTFRALRHRNFRLFIAGQIISFVGSWMEQTAMGWLVYQLTNSTVLLGVVSAAGTAPMLLFSMWGGSLADRIPKRRILVVTQTVSMILAFILAALAWLGHIQPWQILVIAVLNGVAMGFDMPARQSFVVEMTSREDLLNAVSLSSSVFNCARLVGPSLAGFTLAHGGAALCFFINGASFIAAIVALLMMRFPPHAPAAHAASPAAHAMEGLRYVWNHTRVFTILVLTTVVGIFGWSYSVLLPAYARDVLGVGADGYGGLLSAAGGGALVGALAVASTGHKFHPRSLALAGLWFFSAVLLVFAFSWSFPLSIAAQALASLGMIIFFSTSNSTMQLLVSDEMRGRVGGVWSLVFGSIIPLGSLQAGLLARGIGIRWTIALDAIICAVAGMVTLAIIRRRESVRAAVA